VSIRAVAEDLGHNDPGFTRRVYAHPMPLDVVDVMLADRELGRCPSIRC
jgi:hypothetical protein